MSTVSRTLMMLVLAVTLSLGVSACGDSGGDGVGPGDGGVCTPSCVDKQCGDDGCGDQCGVCDDGSVCDGSSSCVAEADCQDSCLSVSADCGSVCGVLCGTCGLEQNCLDFGCVDIAVAGGGPSTDPDNRNDGSGDFQVGQLPQIEVQWGNLSLSNGDKINFSLGSAVVGEAIEVGEIRVTNVGQAVLSLNELSISSIPAGLFVLEPVQSDEMPSAAAPFSVQPSASGGAVEFSAKVMLILDEADTSPAGTITIRSNSEVNDATLLTFTLSADGAAPNIQVTPATIEFGSVVEGTNDTKTVTILNTGTGDLKVTGFVLSGSDTFSFLVGAQEWPVNDETESQGITFEEPIVVPAGTSSNTSVRFTPVDEAGAEATLILYSNDPSSQSGIVVPLSGNLQGPCISINPKKVDFGGKLIGNQAKVEVEILSCGEGPLTISGVSITDLEEGKASSADFGLDLSSLTAEDGSTLDDGPIVIPVNGTRTFQVAFIPDEINKLNPNAEGVCEGQDESMCQATHEPNIGVGDPVPDLGKVMIASDAFNSELEVEIRGFGVEVECPTAVIVVQEGEEVIPQTKLHLMGSQSYAAGGSISKYEWTVQQPVGSQLVFLPSSSAPDPTFEVNVAGSYLFKLRVWDQNNEESCIPAEYTVFVNPDEAIHVELLWHTPLDPDETDEGPEAGADLDLHFLHPFATGEDVDGDGAPDGWFDQPFDCFWFNPHPNWGSLDPAKDDDPGLDLDDTDGAGPENVNLNQPQDGMMYKVGVHYWNDHDFGPSLATVRIYIYSSLVFQLSDVELVSHDMWEVADIAWPSGEVTLNTDLGGSYKITPDYNHPFFPTPD
jgi:hypothetical protein